METVYEVRGDVRIMLLALAIMPDHMHLIVFAASVADLSRSMQLIKGRFARRYNHVLGRAGAVWQSRYHERTLRDEAALVRAIQYVHHNPIEAGLASEVGDYAWSSADGQHVTDLLEYLGQAEA